MKSSKGENPSEFPWYHFDCCEPAAALPRLAVSSPAITGHHMTVITGDSY
jgi:hypothetical protein